MPDHPARGGVEGVEGIEGLDGVFSSNLRSMMKSNDEHEKFLNITSDSMM